MKKKKLAIRIMAIVLLILMVAGMIVPYVAAAEIQEETSTEQNGFSEEDINIGDVTAEDLEILDNVPSEMINEYMATALNGEDTTDVVQNIADYLTMVQEEESQDENSGIVFDGITIELTAIPIEMENPVFSVFVGNLETQETKMYQLNQMNEYKAELGLEDGCYVVFSNKLAWANNVGDIYAVNGGNNQFFTIGDVDTDNYPGISFINIDTSLVLGFDIIESVDDYQVLEPGTTLIINESDAEFPKEIFAQMENDGAEQVPADGEVFNPDNLNTDDEKKDEDDTPDTAVGVLGYLFGSILKKSWLPLILLVVVGVAYKIVLIKKENELEKNLEEDLYDDKYIK